MPIFTQPIALLSPRCAFTHTPLVHCASHIPYVMATFCLGYVGLCQSMWKGEQTCRKEPAGDSDTGHEEWAQHSSQQQSCWWLWRSSMKAKRKRTSMADTTLKAQIKSSRYGIQEFLALKSLSHHSKWPGRFFNFLFLSSSNDDTILCY